jgi:hypothetical protein
MELPVDFINAYNKYILPDFSISSCFSSQTFSMGVNIHNTAKLKKLLGIKTLVLDAISIF